MFKIKRLALITSILTTLAPAITTTAQASLYFSGFYSSLGLGGILTKGKHKFKDPDVGKAESTLSNFGGATSFSLGYVTEKGVSTVMLGGEIYALKVFNNIKKRIEFEDRSTQGILHVHHNAAYGASFILGKLINPKIMVYAKITYEFGAIAYKYKELPSPFTSATFDRTKNYKKIVPGAGFRYAISDRFHIGAEYSLAAIGKVDILKGVNTMNGQTRQAESKILDNRLLVTFTYQITAPKGN
ncbi:MAG: porin family protein [Alphaproteobacteria bacterium]|nr:porin family protein [Alphaproteobacteria bacterium]